MSALSMLYSEQWWLLAGWTMLHFLWIGALVGVVAGTCRLAVRWASPQVRYAAALAALAIVATLPVAIFGWLAAKPQASDMPPRSDVAVAALAVESAAGERQAINNRAKVNGVEARSVALPRNNAIPSSDVAHSTTDPTATDRLTLAVFALETSVPYLPWLWLVGTPLTFALLATGVVGAERLRRTSRIIGDGPIADACARLARATRISRRVTVAICERIAAPVLVGIVRPVILLPPSALTGWSPDEIEMVLLHELAHVRRWDNLVNLMQRIVESLLFFHPAVWLVSHWVRREREACCDAVVVGRTNRPQAYATLLVTLAESLSEPGRPRPRSDAFTRGRGRPGSLVASAMAAGPLRSRIRRILKLEDDPMLVSGKSLAMVTSGLLLAATLVVLDLPTRGQAEQSTTVGTENTEIDAVGQLAIDERHDRSDIIDLRATDFPSGKRLAVVLPHPISSDAISDAVQKLNKEGHNVHVQPIDGATLLFVYGAEHGERFPSLEDQKLADLAYRLLNLELEPIGEEELKRVQALGYHGGVKVTGGRSVNDGVVWENDVLVGLGVWPTTSLKGVADVLEREDLAELTPLKFYVVRPIMTEVDYEKWGKNAKDMVVTGRISVGTGQEALIQDMLQQNLMRLRRSRRAAPAEPTEPATQAEPPAATAGATTSATPQSTVPVAAAPRAAPTSPVMPQPAAPAPALPSIAVATLEPIPQRALAVDSSSSAVDSRTEAAAIDANLVMLNQQLVQAQQQLSEQASAAMVDESQVDRLRQQIAALEKQIQNYRKGVYAEREQARTFDEAQRSFAEATRRSESARALAEGGRDYKSTVRYQGGTFDDWREIWRNELSIVSRQHALPALAAFGASGYGKEVAEAILDVAGQYDWFNIDNDQPSSILVKSCLGLFDCSRYRSFSSHTIPVEETLPLVIAAAKSNDMRRRTVAIRILMELAPLNALAANGLVKLCGEPDEKLRTMAYEVYCNVMPSNQPVIEYLREVVQNADNPESAASANAALEAIKRSETKKEETRSAGGRSDE